MERARRVVRIVDGRVERDDQRLSRGATPGRGDAPAATRSGLDDG